MSHEWRASRGPVIDVFPSRRDSVEGPFPSFHAEVHCPRGMSGGPVFDTNGGVVGVVSRGLDLAPGEPPVSFCASIAPIFTMPMPLGDSMEPIGQSKEIEHLQITGPSVTIADDEGGQTVTWASGPQ